MLLLVEPTGQGLIALMMFEFDIVFDCFFFLYIMFFLSYCVEQLRRVNVFFVPPPPHWHVRAAAHSSLQDVVLNLSIRAGGCV